MTQNLVSENLTNDHLVAVDAAPSALESNLSGTVSLSPDRRRSVPHMGDKSEGFCRQALSLLGQIDQSQPRTRALTPKWIVREDVSGRGLARHRVHSVLPRLAFHLGKMNLSPFLPRANPQLLADCLDRVAACDQDRNHFFDASLERTVDESDRRTIDHIERFGCSVLHIAAEDELPPFTYSVGITRTSSAPEVVVVGLKREIAHYVVNEYNRRVRAGERLVPGQRYSGFIEGFEVEVVQVDRSFYEEYFGHNLWLYQGPNFEVLQLVYPNTSGVWPWQTDANEGFKSWQPVLGKLAHVHF